MACVGCITLLLVEFGLDSVVLGSYVIGVSMRAMVNADDEVCSSHSRVGLLWVKIVHPQLTRVDT